jgi:branched-subunit amino acid aminotransferase/4-amino-4-deoxychorismate lyase
MYLFKLREHYERLLRGCKMLWIDIPYTAQELCDITIEVVERSGYTQDLYIRPVAYKSAEVVANLNLKSLDDGFFCLAVPFGNYIDSDGAISCCVASYRRIDDTMVPPRFKLSGLYLNSILAKTDALATGFDEAIMLNMDGHVCEGTGENIFVVKDGRIITNSLAASVLGGITRNSVMTALSWVGVTTVNTADGMPSRRRSRRPATARVGPSCTSPWSPAATRAARLRARTRSSRPASAGSTSPWPIRTGAWPAKGSNGCARPA